MKMETNKLIILLLDIVLFGAGTTIGLFFNLGFAPLAGGANQIVLGVLFAFSFFVLSIAFFGFFSPVLFFLLGLMESSVFLTNPAGVLAFMIAGLVSSNAGSMLGQAANREINTGRNLLEDKKIIIAALVIGLVLGALAGYLFGLNLQVPFLQQFMSPTA